MATAGSIVVNLIANTGQFTKKMKLSEKTLQRFESAVGNVAKMAARFGVVAATAAAGGLTLLTKNAMANIDATAKLSDRLGVSTEFLAAFGHEAKIAGASQETFVKGIQYMLKNIGEANMGLKSYQDAFELIGLDYKKLKSDSPENAFLKIAKRLRDTENASVRVSAAMRIFGRSGSQLLNLMQGDLDGVIERARELGIAFGRDTAREVERANDAITDMKAAFEGLGNTIAINVSAEVAAAADAIKRLITGSSYELYAFQAGLHEISAKAFERQEKAKERMRFAKYTSPAAYLSSRIITGDPTARKEEALQRAAEAWEKANRIADKVIDKFVAKVPKVKPPTEGGISEADLIRRLGDQAAWDRAIERATPLFSNFGDHKKGLESPESFKPSAREIDSSMVSVSGLSMQGKEYTYERRQVSLLEQIARNTGKTANQEILN